MDQASSLSGLGFELLSIFFKVSSNADIKKNTLSSVGP
jgi:hypothetical protein